MDWFLSVRSSFLGIPNMEKPVTVPVRPKKAKKTGLDRTFKHYLYIYSSLSTTLPFIAMQRVPQLIVPSEH